MRESDRYWIECLSRIRTSCDSVIKSASIIQSELDSDTFSTEI